MSSSVGAQEEKLVQLRSHVMRGRWSKVFKTYKQERALRISKITGTGDTVLHMAVSSGKKHVVANMVDLLVCEEKDEAQNNVVVAVDGDGEQSWDLNSILGAENDKQNTPLHLAASMGNVEICKKMGCANPFLIARRNIVGETPLFLAALNGKKKAFLWLHHQYMSQLGVSSTEFAHCIRDNNDTILHCTITEGHFGRWLPKMKEKHTWSLHIMNVLLQQASDEDMSRIIPRRISEQLSISLQREEDNVSESGAITIETPLIIAAKNGVIEMVEKILELFPSRIKDVNAEGKNIVLLAVEYRQVEVFKYLCKQKWLTESLFREVDKEGNNALHMAAKLGAKLDWLNPEKAFSINMLREINWFKFVKESMPHGLLERYNRKMETPEDMFRKSHKELMKREGEWVAKTSQACSVVSTLVMSVAFATRTNVPGGYDDNGYTVLRNKPVFEIFEVSSFAALFFSLISTICFLSIVASPSQYVNSWRYIPSTLNCGMSCMFVSIVLLWISFCIADSFMVYSQKSEPDFQYYILWSLFIFLLVVKQLPVFLGPTVSTYLPNHFPRRKAARPIEYRRTKNKENTTDLNPIPTRTIP